jgi:hypothetical protein
MELRTKEKPKIVPCGPKAVNHGVKVFLGLLMADRLQVMNSKCE